jgi:hypothetical protein
MPYSLQGLTPRDVISPLMADGWRMHQNQDEFVCDPRHPVVLRSGDLGHDRVTADAGVNAVTGFGGVGV